MVALLAHSLLTTTSNDYVPGNEIESEDDIDVNLLFPEMCMVVDESDNEDNEIDNNDGDNQWQPGEIIFDSHTITAFQLGIVARYSAFCGTSGFDK